MTAPNELSLPHVRLVQASAGSGKTYQLTKRYVQWLLLLSPQSPNPPREILAITFTNKAAHEMKARILFLLKKACLSQWEDWEIEDILKPINLSPEIAAMRAKRLLTLILEEYHFFCVSTIDSFINTLLSANAYYLGLSAHFTIATQSKEFMLEALDELCVLSQSDRNIQQVFEQFTQQFLFLENRGSWNPKPDLLKTMMMLYRMVNTHALPLKASHFDMQNVYADKSQLREILTRFSEVEDLPLHKRFKDGLKGLLEKSTYSLDIDDFGDYFLHEQPPLLKDGQIEDRFYQDWERIRTLLHDICLGEAFGVFNAYIHVFDRAYEILLKHQRQDDILFLEELNARARALLENKVLDAAHLSYRLAARYKHFLIDECQDTNPSQWLNLKVFIDEALATDGSLFIVGDVKQAIYGFRGGDSRLMGQMENDFAALLQKADLSVNRRSQKAIVDFNNALFHPDHVAEWCRGLMQKELSLRSEHIDHIVQVFSSSQQQASPQANGGAVMLLMMDAPTKEERHVLIKEELLRQIQRKKEVFAYQQMAILVRSNNQVEDVTGWLLENSIPVQSDRTTDIMRHPLIIEIMTLLKWLYNPNDKIAFAQILLGDMAVQVWGLKQDQMAQFCFEFRQKDLWLVFEKEYPQVSDQYLKHLLNILAQNPVYEIVIEIYRIYRLQDIYPEALAFLMHFLEIIKEHDDQAVDLGAFLEFFPNIEERWRFIPKPANDAIIILTVHKAKGLEFDCVFIPFLELSVSVGAGSKEGGQSYSTLFNEGSLGLIRLKKTYTRFCPPLSRLWQEEYYAALINELCVLYVALTRAVEEMIIFIPSKAGAKNNEAKTLVADFPLYWGQERVLPLKEKKMLPQTKILSSLALRDWTKNCHEDFSELEAKRQQRDQSLRWHQILSHLKFLDKALLSQQIKEAQAKVMTSTNGLYSQEMEIEDLSQFLRREDVWFYFSYQDGAQLHTEWELINRWGDLKRMDRVLVFPTEIHLIDFKWSRVDDDFHQDQMQEYQEILKEIYPQHRLLTRLIYYHHEI